MKYVYQSINYNVHLLFSTADSSLQTSNSVTEVTIPLTEEAKFDAMIIKFGITMENVKSFISAKNPPIDKLIAILGWPYRALKPRLKQCKSVDEVLEVIEDKCSLLNLSCMEAIAEHFQIKEAQDCITSYNDALSKYCKNIRISPCIGKHFIQSTSTEPLKCETVKFTLDWKVDEYRLGDIRGLLCKAFEELADEVTVVDMKTGNSIILTCYSSHTVTSLLILKAQRNLSILTEKGVMSLSIGYCVVLEYTAKIVSLFTTK